MKITEVIGRKLTAVYCKNNYKLGVYENDDPEGLLKLLGVEIYGQIPSPTMIKEEDFPYHLDNLPGRNEIIKNKNTKPKTAESPVKRQRARKKKR